MQPPEQLDLEARKRIRSLVVKKAKHGDPKRPDRRVWTLMLTPGWLAETWEECRDYWLRKPDRERPSNYEAAFRTWLRRAYDYIKRDGDLKRLERESERYKAETEAAAERMEQTLPGLRLVSGGRE